MQQRRVRRVRHRRQQLTLQRGRLGQHRQGLPRVRGDDDGVVAGHVTVAVGDLDTRWGLEHRGDLRAHPDVGEQRLDLAHVGARPAGDRAPLRRTEDAEHAVVVEEGEQVARRVVEGDLRLARPDARHDRLHEVPDEVAAEVALGEEVAQRAGVVLDVEQGPGLAVEAGDLGEHRQVARLAQVGRGREQSRAAQRAGPLQRAVVVLDRHRHLGGLGGDAELGEHPQQHRVGARVVHDEAGVDGQRLVGTTRYQLGHQVGVGVPTQPVVGLVERDVGRARGDVGSRQPRDAGTDDRDVPSHLKPRGTRPASPRRRGWVEWAGAQPSRR